jgi:hypothetical protein
MGWINYNKRTKAQVVEEILHEGKKGEEYTTTREDLSRISGNPIGTFTKRKLIAHGWGSAKTLWQVWQAVVILPGKPPHDFTYLILSLIEGGGDDVGVKDMGEEEGPFYYDCPKGLLELVPEGTKDQHGRVTTNASWRAKVALHWKEKSLKSAESYQRLKDMRPGQVWTLPGRIPDRIRISRIATGCVMGHALDAPPGTLPYRVAKRFLGTLVTEQVAEVVGADAHPLG